MMIVLRFCELLILVSSVGSQNGYNHSGKFGNIGFMRGTMGIANAQRTLSYIQSLAQFVSQPEYVNVVQVHLSHTFPKLR